MSTIFLSIFPQKSDSLYPSVKTVCFVASFGVPQGSNLGFLLYFRFIDDIIDHITDVK